MADYLEAANLLRILIHKMRGTVSEGNNGTHLDIDVTKSEMQRLIEASAAAGFDIVNRPMSPVESVAGLIRSLIDLPADLSTDLVALSSYRA